MYGPRQVGRREFLSALVFAAVGYVAGRSPIGTLRSYEAEAALSPRVSGLSSLLAGNASADVVGSEYLAHHPGEHDRARLARLLSRSLADEIAFRRRPGEMHGREVTGRREGEDRDSLAPSLRSAIKRDFAERRTVMLRGWVVSRTEARLCALVHLS